MTAGDFAINSKKRKLIIIAVVAIVFVCGGAVAWWQLSGEQQWARRQEQRAGIAQNRQQLEEAETKLQKEELSAEEQYNTYVQAAILGAAEGKPEARDYAKKALEIRGDLVGETAGMEDVLVEQLRQIEQGVYDSVQ